MKARDIMTTSVVTVPIGGTVEDAVRLMLDHHVSALPVVDAKGRLAGLISEGDLMRRVRDGTGQRRPWWLELISGEDDSDRDFVAMRSHHVSDVMTRNVETADEEMPTGEIARLLEKKRIKRVPVVRDGMVVGIVSRSNLLQVLAQVEEGKLPLTSATDQEIRKRISAALDEVPGAQKNLVNFFVDGGKVSVWGVADSDYVENAVRVAIENVSGVQSVEMNLGRLPPWGYGV